ncbi:DUF7344 domain-containing protein [Halorussus halophilus]|uniref:DUF7344 domain-containing protein n=1 Tax=Halorussus halophilus TaxID=2650975 RepID=UPI001300DCA1|nr:hypothetical protein [Halorussus halophilus]
MSEHEYTSELNQSEAARQSALIELSVTADSTERLQRVLRTVASDRRRYVLRCFTQKEREVPLGKVATRVAAFEESEPTEVVSKQAIERERTRLHHVDLPKLDDAEFLDYDPQANLVTLPDASSRGPPYFQESLRLSEDE